MKKRRNVGMAGREVPEGGGAGRRACGLGLRGRAGRPAGAGTWWPGGCPVPSPTRVAQALAASAPCGPSALPGEFPAGISPPLAPWNGETSAPGACDSSPRGAERGGHASGQKPQRMPPGGPPNALTWITWRTRNNKVKRELYGAPGALYLSPTRHSPHPNPSTCRLWGLG